MTINAYIDSQREEIQTVLRSVYRTIASALPDAEERISWQMPTFWKGRNLIHFAPAKKHIGIYPGSEAVDAFQSELTEKGIAFSKGTIRFPYGAVDLDLIRRIAEWCRQDAAETL